MADILKAVEAKAREYGYQLLATSPSDAYQCPASFQTEGFKTTIYLHLPLAKPDDRLIVYEYLSIPIEVDSTHHMSVHPRHPVIATDERREFFITMPVDMLAKCDKLGAYFLCDGLHAKHRASRRTEFIGEENDGLCTWFLLTQNQQAVSTACPIHLHKKQSGVYSVDKNNFVIVEVEDQQGVKTCHGKEVTHHQVSGPTRVHLDPGCSFETKNTLVNAGVDLGLNATPISYKWEKSPAEYFKDLDLDHYKLLEAEANATKSRVPRDVKDIRDWVTRDRERQAWVARNTAWNSSDNMSTTAVVITVVVVIGALTILVTCWYCKRKQARIQAERDTGRELVRVANPAFLVPPYQNDPLFYNGGAGVVPGFTNKFREIA